MKIFLFLLLIGSNAYWLYEKIDQGVTKAYEDQGRYEIQGALQDYKKLSEYLVKGMDKNALKRVLITLGHEPYVKDGTLRGGWVAFELNNQGLVTGVVYE